MVEKGQNQVCMAFIKLKWLENHLIEHCSIYYFNGILGYWDTFKKFNFLIVFMIKIKVKNLIYQMSQRFLELKRLKHCLA